METELSEADFAAPSATVRKEHNAKVGTAKTITKEKKTGKPEATAKPKDPRLEGLRQKLRLRQSEKSHTKSAGQRFAEMQANAESKQRGGNPGAAVSENGWLDGLAAVAHKNLGGEGMKSFDSRISKSLRTKQKLLTEKKERQIKQWTAADEVNLCEVTEQLEKLRAKESGEKAWIEQKRAEKEKAEMETKQQKIASELAKLQAEQEAKLRRMITKTSEDGEAHDKNKTSKDEDEGARKTSKRRKAAAH